jgi:hypothetical protein
MNPTPLLTPVVPCVHSRVFTAPEPQQVSDHNCQLALLITSRHESRRKRLFHCCCILSLLWKNACSWSRYLAMAAVYLFRGRCLATGVYMPQYIMWWAWGLNLWTPVYICHCKSFQCCRLQNKDAKHSWLHSHQNAHLQTPAVLISNTF